MRLTTRTNLALRMLMFCAVNAGRTVRRHDAATACNASENHLAQVIHALARAGFLATTRGRAGGVRLARPAASIRIGDVVRRFEGVLPFAPCMDPAGSDCLLRACCLLKCVLSDALRAFHATLDGVTLGDLVQPNREVEAVLRIA